MSRTKQTARPKKTLNEVVVRTSAHQRQKKSRCTKQRDRFANQERRLRILNRLNLKLLEDVRKLETDCKYKRDELNWWYTHYIDKVVVENIGLKH
jgi:hypothetical protein